MRERSRGPGVDGAALPGADSARAVRLEPERRSVRAVTEWIHRSAIGARILTTPRAGEDEEATALADGRMDRWADGQSRHL